MGLNLWDVAAHALAQTPLVAVAVAALYALFSREFHKLREEVARLRGEVARVGESVRQLARVFHAYGTALVHALSSRGVLTGAEAVILTGLLDLVPPARTKYYTEEARRRLVELLRMGAEGRLGPAEVRELEHIARLIYAEWRETGREDLADFYWRLRAALDIVKGRLVAEGKLPPGELFSRDYETT
jgi:hypothetical protein